MARQYTKNNANYTWLPPNTFNGLLSGAPACSVAAWIRPDSGVTATALDNRIFSANSSTTAGLVLAYNSAGTITLGGRSRPADGFNQRSSSATTPLDSWGLIGGVLDYSGDTITPYVNGAASNGGTATFGAASNAYEPGSTTARDGIGAQLTTTGPSGGTPTQFSGTIAEVAIWGAALSADEWAALARRAASPLDWRRSALMLYLPLLGAGLRDLAGSGIVLTEVGSVPAVDGPPVAMPFARRGRIFLPAASVVAPVPGVLSGQSAVSGTFIGRSLVSSGLAATGNVSFAAAGWSLASGPASFSSSVAFLATASSIAQSPWSSTSIVTTGLVGSSVASGQGSLSASVSTTMAFSGRSAVISTLSASAVVAFVPSGSARSSGLISSQASAIFSPVGESDVSSPGTNGFFFRRFIMARRSG